ncbi:nitroreductase/quinone reductase family protein [Jongsikchunia kroppenstedtii]|uniref:nitroreductase/quinone reductase family protein n=1 Tax=Jongsikchunia kroppenstedtii TaxID=1121721 RepID=UPI0003602D62|nr:nitroreductase/quinone reductase family protein [Jongsikchunia kroppenstedtii]
MNTFQRVAKAMNSVVMPILRIPGLSGLAAKSMTVLVYRGRRSGKSFELPVGYRRSGENTLQVAVAMPDQKTWWRNFTGDGADLTVRLPEGDRSGHAVATRDDAGRVLVAIELR